MVQFVDEVVIKVSAGSGGNGCASFRRLKYVPLGGPDGGDGGRGGSVFLIADKDCSSLIALKYRKLYKAESGKHGSGQDKIGAKGKDLYIKVPVGTQIQHPVTREILADLVTDQASCCIAKGGDPGLGNIHFKSSRNRAPRKCTLGKSGDNIEVLLSLKVIADVGLVGLPNAGKSSLISVVSAATPKVADYPFTTIRPHLGVVEVDTSLSFIMADIPGLISGAATGQGLGTYFLKHLSRCKLLLHLVSLEFEDQEIANNIIGIEQELDEFDANIRSKSMCYVFTKSDLMLEHEVHAKIENVLGLCAKKGHKYFAISSTAHQGLRELINFVAINLSSD